MEYRRMTAPDDELLAFCQRQQRYYALARQQVTRAYVASDFLAPPGFSEDHHWHYKIFDGDAMIAYIDYYDGYRHPMRHDERSLWIGLFLVDERWQHRHIGRSIIQQLCVQYPQHARIQLACYDDNTTGLAFWRSMGFVAIGRSQQAERKLIVMERGLLNIQAFSATASEDC